MGESDEATSGQSSSNRDADIARDNPTRAEERGEADEPNAPTSGEENEGMSTILDAEPLSGVQDNASEK